MSRLLALGLVLLTGCSASLPAVRGYHDTLRQRIHRAKALGAMECAPAELAAAQAHYRFATLELSQGDATRAEGHVLAGIERADLAITAGVECPASGVSVKDLLADPWPDADGDAVADDEDLCRWAIEDRDGFADMDGCPEPDNDLDGVLDRQDDCPVEAEDRDGYKDEDGCPDEDNDSDGVLDLDDYCPNAPETANGFEDEDGCPDFRPEHIDLFDDHIAFRKPLTFIEKSPILLGLSHPALRELGQVLQANPDVHVTVRGHTDNRGDPEFLQKLSDGRARAVVEFLVREGIDASRLSAEGVGDEEPIATNRTATGRAANNRVEVKIVAGELPSGGSGL